MKRNFVISDIHGMFFELVRLLKAVNFHPAKDTLTVLGDYIDRGSYSKEVIMFFINLQRKFSEHIVLLKGNHEDMCVQAYRNGKGIDISAMSLWLVNGGTETLESFQGNPSEEVMLFIDSLPLFYETEDFIFVHGGVNSNIPIHLNDPAELLWNRNPVPHCSGKTVIVGHSIHENVTFYPESNTLCIDTGACRATFGKQGKLSIVDLTNSKVHWVTTGCAGDGEYGFRELERSPFRCCVTN